jgi:hypothetical protein
MYRLTALSRLKCWKPCTTFVTTADLADYIIQNPALPGFLLSDLPVVAVRAADLACELYGMHYRPALLRYTAVCVCHYLQPVLAAKSGFPGLSATGMLAAFPAWVGGINSYDDY